MIGPAIRPIRLFRWRAIAWAVIGRQPVPDQEAHAVFVGLIGVATNLAAEMRDSGAAGSVNYPDVHRRDQRRHLVDHGHDGDGGAGPARDWQETISASVTRRRRRDFRVEWPEIDRRIAPGF